MSVVMAYFHHLLAFSLLAILFAEYQLLSKNLSVENAGKIRQLDLFYGIVAGVLLVVGVLRVMYFEKGAGYYLHSPWFHMKMTLYVLVALLSIYPTIQFFGWRIMIKRGDAPQLSTAQLRLLRRLIYLQLIGIAGIIFCAVAMAKGLSFSAS